MEAFIAMMVVGGVLAATAQVMIVYSNYKREVQREKQKVLDDNETLKKLLKIETLEDIFDAFGLKGERVQVDGRELWSIKPKRAEP